MNVLDLPDGTIEEDGSSLTVVNTQSHKQIWSKESPHYPSTRLIHRVNGPAIIYANSQELWVRNGIDYTPTAHERMAWELRKKNECS